MPETNEVHGPNAKVCLEDVSLTYNQERLQVDESTRSYSLWNYSDRKAAMTALITDPLCPLADPDYPQLIRKKVEIADNTTDDGLPEFFRGSAAYEKWIPDIIGDEILSGSVRSQTQNVRQTWAHISSNSAHPSGPINAFGMLHVTPDGNVQGLDVGFPALEFQIRKTYFKNSVANLATLANLVSYVEQPNSAPWRGFGVAEVKLIGADVSNLDDNEDQIVFSFAASPTFIDIPITSPWGVIVVPIKRGWDELWVQYVPNADRENSSGFTVPVAHTVHVDQPQRLSDLNAILP